MTNNFENWLAQVRVELYEKIKTLNKEDAVALINEGGRKTAKKYSISVVKTEREY